METIERLNQGDRMDSGKAETRALLGCPTGGEIALPLHGPTPPETKAVGRVYFLCISLKNSNSKDGKIGDYIVFV